MGLTSDELELLRRSVRSFLEPFRPVQGSRDDSADARRRVWSGVADQLGLTGLGIAEQHGGLGAERVARQMVLEEFGRALVPAPILGTFAVTRVIAESGDTVAAERLLPEIARGALTAGFSVSAGITAQPDGPGHWRLSGEVRNVVDGTDAGLLLLLAVPQAEAANAKAFLVEAGSAGVTTSSINATDPTRKLASVVLDGAEGAALGEVAHSGMKALIAQDLAFEQLGGARWCLETTRDFANLRSQFGRTIGSFQAIKHMLADVLLENEAAWSAAAGFQDELDGTDGRNQLVGSIVHALASEAYFRAAGTAVQVHGAIAITDETDMHLHFKRATTTRQMLGGVPRHYRLVLDAALESSSGLKADRVPSTDPMTVESGASS